MNQFPDYLRGDCKDSQSDLWKENHLFSHVGNRLRRGFLLSMVFVLATAQSKFSEESFGLHAYSRTGWSEL